jgi:hypothetical protein
MSLAGYINDDHVVTGPSVRSEEVVEQISAV